MNPPLERAARALHEDYVEGRIRMGMNPSDLPAWEDLGPDGEYSFYAPARAVIAAIRDIDGATLKTVDGLMIGSDVYVARGRALDTWTHLINALLEEGR